MSKKTTNNFSLDDVLELLGPFGKYNLLNYTLFLLPILLAGHYGSVYIFEGMEVNHRCSLDECETSAIDATTLHHAIPMTDRGFSKCTRYGKSKKANIGESCDAEVYFDNSTEIACSSYVYDTSISSVVTDFDIACQDWKRTLIGTVHNSGLFVSLPVTGLISDRYGRKVAISVAALMNGVFGFLRSFSTSYIMLLIFEFLESGCGAGMYTTGFVLAMEMVGPKGRVLGNTLINAVYVIGAIDLGLLAWQLQNWRWLLRIIYAPAILIFSYKWILNESVRWLLSKGRTDEAIVILKKAARMNNIELSEEVLIPLAEMHKIAESNTNDATDTERTVDKVATESTFKKVMKSRIIKKRLLVCSFLWMTCTFVYYGLSINSVSLAGNKYMNFMLVIFVEIPANLLCLVVLNRLGRKKTLVIFYVLSAFLCITLSLIGKSKEMKWVSLVVYLSGKFCITVTYSSVYIYVSEVFPTNVRQSLLAVCSTFGRIGSTLAPLTPLLMVYYEGLPAIFFGCMALIASISVFTLPETINVSLPDTIEEAENLEMTKKNIIADA